MNRLQCCPKFKKPPCLILVRVYIHQNVQNHSPKFFSVIPQIYLNRKAKFYIFNHVSRGF